LLIFKIFQIQRQKLNERLALASHFFAQNRASGELLFGANFRVVLGSARELEGFAMLDVSQGDESLRAHNLHDDRVAIRAHRHYIGGACGPGS
jgi:hypothetical protein